MPNISQLKESRFLKKEDCGAGILRTIAGCHEEVLENDGQSKSEWVLTFSEPDTKPFILKSTNAQVIASFLGSDETDDWTGRKIVLYNDPTVTMKGKVVGGIRVRAPRASAIAPKAPVAPPPEALPEPTEDVPF